VQRLSLLRETLPSVHRIAVLSNHRRVVEARMGLLLRLDFSWSQHSSVLTMLLPALSAGQVVNSRSGMNQIPTRRAVQGLESF
jgi:hypothetical protein